MRIKENGHRRSGRGMYCGALAVSFAAAAAMCMIPAVRQTVPAWAETPGCTIALAPTAPDMDNGDPSVYGYYNGDSEVAVDIFVQASAEDCGIRKIEYMITNGTEKVGETGVLYEDTYIEPVVSETPEESGEPDRPEEPDASERTEEPQTSAGSENPEKTDDPGTPEDVEDSKDPGEPEKPEEPEEPEESGESEDSKEPEEPEESEESGEYKEPEEPEDSKEPEEPEEPEKSGEHEEPEEPEDSEEPEESEEPGESEEPEGGFDGKDSEAGDFGGEDNIGESREDPEEKEPDAPEEPDAVDESDAPEESDAPDESEESDESGASEEPEEPGEPDASEELEGVEEPDASEEPEGAEDPDAPEEPDEPEGAEESDAPEEPDEPEGAEEPDAPEEPDEPDESDEPEEPEEPGESSEPETPAESERYHGIQCWEGRVTVDTSRWHTGDVQVHVTAEDFSGTVREAEVRLNIDTYAPAVTVSFDNNEVNDGRYFNAPRTATVVITEHNFDTSLVNFGTVSDVSWSNDGDVHTATVTFTEDGDYTFDVSVRDMAGNISGTADFGDSQAGTEFTVDCTEPEIDISGVLDAHAYRGDVTPEVLINDSHFSDYEISFTRTRLDEIDVDVTERFFSEKDMNEQGGELICGVFEKVRDNDGIYRLRISATDRAGNESERSVDFSVNRFGSVYVFNDYLISLIRDGGIYTQEIEQNLVITEYNADRLIPGSLLIDVTRDGRPVSDVLCDLFPSPGMSESTGSRGWYEYRYIIDKENFTADGIYKMSISSEDEAGNTPDNSAATGMDILFRVDATAPEISGKTKTDDRGILSDGENFEYSVYDTIGLKSLDVFINDEIIDDGFEDFGDDLNRYTGTVALETGAARQKVRVTATDLAGNVTEREFDVPSGVRTLQEIITSPAAALEQLAEGGILLPVALGAAAAAAFILILLFAVGEKNKRKNSEKGSPHF